MVSAVVFPMSARSFPRRFRRGLIEAVGVGGVGTFPDGISAAIPPRPH